LAPGDRHAVLLPGRLLVLRPDVVRDAPRRLLTAASAVVPVRCLRAAARHDAEEAEYVTQRRARAALHDARRPRPRADVPVLDDELRRQGSRRAAPLRIERELPALRRRLGGADHQDVRALPARPSATT